MVIQPIHHAFDHGAGLVSFTQVRITAQHGLFGSGSFHGIILSCIGFRSAHADPAYEVPRHPVQGRMPGCCPMSCLAAHQPFTAPAVRPLTIWRWKTITSRNSGAVIDTAAATATTWSVVVVSRLNIPAIAGTMVWLLASSSREVTRKSL
ncbi:hypothetical protein PM02_14610 [Sulfitobacter mediterraneus]|uniref:Uncharacterized protein n=1 Tax=Sulfitobacter mediterraneus TaxID=83219 RepID=A0A061SRY4_9RHOB|nr:hypothetical protein PM02_14610 [Sulfitobacter mediterraneus]